MPLSPKTFDAWVKTIEHIRKGEEFLHTKLDGAVWFLKDYDSKTSPSSTSSCGTVGTEIENALFAAHRGDTNYSLTKGMRQVSLGMASRREGDLVISARGIIWLDGATVCKALLHGRLTSALRHCLKEAARGLKTMDGTVWQNAKFAFDLKDALDTLQAQEKITDSAPGEASSSESGISTDAK